MNKTKVPESILNIDFQLAYLLIEKKVQQLN